MWCRILQIRFVFAALSLALCLSYSGLAQKDKEISPIHCDQSATTGKYWATFVVDSKRDFEKIKKPKFKITSWYERLGNNFIQIKRAIRYAVCCRGKLEIKQSHPFLPRLKRLLDFSSWKGAVPGYNPPEDCQKGREDNFFYSSHTFPEPQCVFDEYSALQYLIFGNEYQYGCLNPLIQCNEGIEQALVVHIRSGDIFGWNPHPPYRQPPVVFYQQIFQSRQWETIIFVTSIEASANYNPVWTYFSNKRNLDGIIGNHSSTSVIFQMSTSLVEDMKTLWCARYFVSSSSTLSNMIIHTAPYLKEVFGVKESLFGSCTHYNNRVKSQGLKCHQITLPGYYASDWVNSPQQREKIITYRIPKEKGAKKD